MGQTKAKKVTSVAIYNHYQRIREVKRLEAEEEARRETKRRWAVGEREMAAHPVESRFTNSTLFYFYFILFYFILVSVLSCFVVQEEVYMPGYCPATGLLLSCL